MKSSEEVDGVFRPPDMDSSKDSLHGYDFHFLWKIFVKMNA